MEKVILVNKKRGMTSYQVVREFKKKYPGEKIGHAGTLDPLAEGVLLILVGKATKKQSELMALSKEYYVEAGLGFTTTTWDMEGEVVTTSKKKIKNKEEIETILKTFEGNFEQVIPAFSAVKVKGQRLYRLARAGKVSLADLPKKIVKIDKITLLGFSVGKQSVKLLMTVGKGTYVRSVVYQLGLALGVGATVTRLVRTRVGEYKIKENIKISL